MFEHHTRAINTAKEKLLSEQADILAIVLGGSIAKGNAREDSDVDLIVVVPDHQFAGFLESNQITFLRHDCCDYEGGYVEGNFVGRSFIKDAAERGSEPTRYSFVGAYLIHCVDPRIEEWLNLIPIYPENQRQGNIDSFYAQFRLNSRFFWREGKRHQDGFLMHRAAVEIVLFGCRLILAYNRLLFPGQKQMIEQLELAEQKPDDLISKVRRFMTDMTEDAKEDFCQAIEEFADWSDADTLSRFIQDVEMSWFNRIHAVSEW